MSDRVLIVDDEPDVARYLSTILQANGFDATIANDVKTGLEKVAEVRPQLICLDIMMPKETGISMYRELKANDSTRLIPVIIISGAEQEDKFDFRAYMPEESIAEPERYMEKPVDVDVFVSTVRKLINSKSDLSEGRNR